MSHPIGKFWIRQNWGFCLSFSQKEENASEAWSYRFLEWKSRELRCVVSVSSKPLTFKSLVNPWEVTIDFARADDFNVGHGVWRVKNKEQGRLLRTPFPALHPLYDGRVQKSLIEARHRGPDVRALHPHRQIRISGATSSRYLLLSCKKKREIQTQLLTAGLSF